MNEEAEKTMALPEQKAFFKIPARFGHVPVAEEPLGYDHERRFEHHYPRIELPFQLVDTVETGIKKRYEKDELFPNGLNRLFFGDCLHVMRMLPSECIDLIYIDPPFFSGGGTTAAVAATWPAVDCLRHFTRRRGTHRGLARGITVSTFRKPAR